jgi:hypothetical protein
MFTGSPQLDEHGNQKPAFATQLRPSARSLNQVSGAAASSSSGGSSNPFGAILRKTGTMEELENRASQPHSKSTSSSSQVNFGVNLRHSEAAPNPLGEVKKSKSGTDLRKILKKTGKNLN